MNDPGLDRPIQDAENEVLPNRDELEKEQQDQDILLDPAHWWMASTAFPLIAGTFGPMATTFNICALVEHWREFIPPPDTEDTGIFIDDPPWLLAVNAVSLLFALIGNGSLLLNMVDRLSFSIAQPLTIVGFTTASFLLIALVGVASSDVFRIEPQSQHALTGAFYYACFAAGLYFLLAILMAITVYGAIAGKYPKEFEINTSQRTLMIQTISFMAYLLIGAAIFQAVEGWRFLDAIYWADFTLLTIGVGDDLVPVTHAGRTLLIFYTFGGILAVGLIIGSIRSMLIQRGAAKLHARVTEKERQKFVTLADAERQGSKASNILGMRHRKRSVSVFDERSRRRREFETMRSIQIRAQKKYRYRALASSATAAAILWLIGALVFYFTEYRQEWTYFQAVYFAWVTLITLGYGDLQPLSNSGRAFFVFWTLLAVPTLTVLISDMGDTVVRGVAELTDYLATFAIAPMSNGLVLRLKKEIKDFTAGRLFRKAEAPKEGSALAKKSSQNGPARTGLESDLLGAHLSEKEREAVAHIHQLDAQSPHDRDTLFYHFILVHEIRRVLADLNSNPPKQYTYDEWSYFLKLLGQDEQSPEYHATRYNNPKHDDENAPQIARIHDHSGNPMEWSWLGLRSPLLAQQEEAEWILHGLLAKLQGELHVQSWPGGGVAPVRPPISIDSLKHLPSSDASTHDGRDKSD